MLLCTLKDTKANLLHHPYLYRTETDFIRAVQQAAKNPEATITQYPARTAKKSHKRNFSAAPMRGGIRL